MSAAAPHVEQNMSEKGRARIKHRFVALRMMIVVAALLNAIWITAGWLIFRGVFYLNGWPAGHISGFDCRAGLTSDTPVFATRFCASWYPFPPWR